MQTFLPYPDFSATARVLDRRRLGKQRVETVQVLRGLTVPGYGWRHHPAVRMWAGYEEALVRYGLEVCREWRAAGRADTCADLLCRELAERCGVAVPRTQEELAAAGELPPWLGDPLLHLSHRSALLRKDPAFYRPLFGDDPDDVPYKWPVSDRPPGCGPCEGGRVRPAPRRWQDGRMRLVDLSVPVTTGMPVYPGDPEVALDPALTVAEHGVNVLRLHLGSQSGTHVDAPFHIDDALPDLDALPLDRFLGPAVVVDARGLAPRSAVPPEAFAAVRAALRPGVIVLVATGWSAHWGTEAYLAHPYLSQEAAGLLVAAGVRTVGIDALSVDPTPPEELPAHRVLCRAHAVIVENLTNLDVLLAAQAEGRPIEAILPPLRLRGADGAPVRALARVG